VWEGPHPRDDAEAGRQYDELFDRYHETDDLVPPTERIRAFVEAAIARWPEAGGREGQSPWGHQPVIEMASGPMFYATLSWGPGPGMAEPMAQLAADHGLVLYDPQTELVLAGLARSRPARAWRMRNHQGRTWPRPGEETVRAALQSLARDGFLVIEDATDPEADFAQVAMQPNGVYQVEHRRSGTLHVTQTVSAERAGDVLVRFSGS